jgi:amidase
MDLSSALTTAAAIRSKEVSPLEVLDACLARVDQVNDRVNAVVWRDDEQARAAAKRAGDAVTAGDDLPPFHGVPLPIKDLTPVEGQPATYGSRGAPAGPAVESELVVKRLEHAGFLLAGRTNTPEFGPITVTENLRYGPTRNPWDLDHTPGGSSGGAAAAVASGMFPVAHGNDGGGSIRIPSSCCGLVGLKPSRGRVPTLVTSWEGASVEGVLTRTVADAATILDALVGIDPLSWYNAPMPLRPYAQELTEAPGTLRIGLVEQAPLGLPVDDEVLAAVRSTGSMLSDLGHDVRSAQMEVPDAALMAFLNIVNSGLADYDGIDWTRTEPHVQANRVAAQAVDSLVYVSSVHHLQRYSREQVARWGSEFDVLLTPTLSILPPQVGVLEEVHANPDAPSMTVFAMAVFNAFFNITGQPAVSLPLHMSSTGLPIGMQLVGGAWQEDVLVRLAAQLEQAHPWADRRATL